MRAVLISIHPQYAAEIYAGTKKFELRKRVPKVPLGTLCLIYETTPVARVTGCFRFGATVMFRVNDVDPLFIHACRVTNEAFYHYYEGREFGYAITIHQPCQFSPTYSLSTFGLTRPPQSYQFINLPFDLLTDL